MQEDLFKIVLVVLKKQQTNLLKYDLRTGLQRLIEWRETHKPEEY